MYPFERFSDPAKKTLTLAQEEAERAAHHWIGTEHLLLALTRVEAGTAFAILREAEIDPLAIRSAIDKVLSRGERTSGQPIVPTARVKKVIELAFEESRRGNRRSVGTGELLLALVLEGEGIAAHVLKDLKLDRELVVERVAAAPSENAARDLVEQRQVERGARVLVHDPEPPYRLWEGRVARIEGGQVFVVAVEDRPAGSEILATMQRIHPVPTGPTFMCRYCRLH